MPFPGYKAVDLTGGLATTAPLSVPFSKSGNTNSGTYLQIGAVVTSNTGYPMRLNNAKITYLAVQSETTDTYSVDLIEWNGATEIVKATVSVNNAMGSDYNPPTDIPLTFGTSLRCRLTTGSCKNPVVVIYVIGEIPL